MFKPHLFRSIGLLIVAIGGLSGCTVPDTTPVKVWRYVEDGAYAADISGDGELVVVSGVQNGINVWQVGQETPLYQWAHQGEGNNQVVSLHIAADKSVVVTSDREAFALWSMETGEPVGFWRIDESSIRDVAVSNQGRGILVARSSGRIMFFEPETLRRLEFMGHQEKVNSIDISPNGKYALSGGNDYTAYLWSTETGQIIHTFTHPTRVTKVALDDQGRYAFTAGSQDKSQIWDIQTGEPVSQLQYIARQKIFTDAVFSEDGKYLLTGSPSRQVYLWDVKTGEKVEAWQVAVRESSPMPTAVVYGVGFAGDDHIITQSSSGLAELWKRHNE
ncbi:WD40 repeat domain-containing protein [Alteromonas sp. CYL-A6]|uniref:WD40 repeat domain-containing protein n=1 Tax=Alteromonas nitratireducens TaxID=3390813 RepID=UPI0034C03A06